MKQLYLLLIITILLSFRNADAQSVSASLGHHNKFPGSVSVPLTVSGFNNITTLTIFLTFDSNALEYTGFQNSAIPGIVVGVSPIPNSSLWRMGLSWQAAGNPQTVNGTLIQINFNYTGGQSELVFDHINNEVTNQNFEPINVAWNNGSVSPPANASIAALNNLAPGNILVPFYVDFSGVVSGVTQFSFAVNYDPGVLNLNGFQNAALGNVQLTEPSVGNLVISRSGSSSQLNGKLLDLVFNYSGGISELVFNVNQCTVQSSGGLQVATYFTNGLVQGMAVSMALSTITASPNQINICQQSIITIQLKNEQGEDITWSAGTVTLESTLGTLSGVTDNLDGSYTAVLSVPNPYITGNATITGKLNGIDFSDVAAVEFLTEPFLTVPEPVQTENDPEMCGALMELSTTSGGFPSPALIFYVGENPVESPYFFPVGTTTVVVSANYECGVLTQSYTVNVLDSEPPATPENGSSFANCLSEVFEPQPPQASDNCAGIVSGVLQSIISTPDPLICEGQIIYTYTYTDASSNASEWKFTWNVLPTTGPMLIGTQTDCSSLDQHHLTWSLAEAQSFNPVSLEEQVAALYQDNCGGTVSATLANIIADPGNSDESWAFIYEFEIADICGNTLLCEVHYAGSLVPENFELLNLTLDKTHCYNATISILVQGLTIANPGNVAIIAGESILFLPDLDVQPGGQLHAYISNVYCVNPTPLTAASESENYPVKHGLNQMHADLKIFPNPTSGIFTVELPEPNVRHKIHIEIFDGFGKLVFKNEYQGQESIQPDLSDTPGGLYFVRVRHLNEILISKLIRL